MTTAVFGFAWQVEMIWQQCPRTTIHRAILCQSSETSDKILSVSSVNEYLSSFYSSAHYMVHNTRGI
jgi:hypothetical protein